MVRPAETECQQANRPVSFISPQVPGRSVHAFPKSGIRHICDIVYDPWRNCLSILNADECPDPNSGHRLDLEQYEAGMKGNHQDFETRSSTAKSNCVRN